MIHCQLIYCRRLTFTLADLRTHSDYRVRQSRENPTSQRWMKKLNVYSGLFCYWFETILQLGMCEISFFLASSQQSMCNVTVRCLQEVPPAKRLKAWEAAWEKRVTPSDLTDNSPSVAGSKTFYCEVSVAKYILTKDLRNNHEVLAKYLRWNFVTPC